jgi:hypothetical protein
MGRLNRLRRRPWAQAAAQPDAIAVAHDAARLRVAVASSNEAALVSRGAGEAEVADAVEERENAEAVLGEFQ